MKGSILFIIGCFVGSVVTQVWMDRHSNDEVPSKESAKDEKKEESSEEASESVEPKKDGFREKTSIDDYTTPSQEEQYKYNQIMKKEGYDPAETEHPTDDESLEAIHEEAKHKPPREIDENEFGRFGYEEESLYYDVDFEVLEYDDESGDTIDDPNEEYRIVGDILKTSDFKTNPEKSVLLIRNYKLRTDYRIYKK